MSSTNTRGVALITVLLVVAVLLSVVSRLSSSHHMVISSHQNTFEQDQALQYVLGAETLAGQALKDDISSGSTSDDLGELWAQPTMPFELDEGGSLEVQLTDMQGCFNVNSIVASSDQMERFKRLLANLGLPAHIADSWHDWIDPDEIVTDFGAEDSEYLLAQPPHRTPGVEVFNKSEFLLLQNIERAHWNVLEPHICLLPGHINTLNVNTASVQALAALESKKAGKPTLADAEAVLSGSRNYNDLDLFIVDFSGFTDVQTALGVSSEYFQLHAHAQVGNSSVTLLSVLRRDKAAGGNVTVIQRDFGKLFRSNLSIQTKGT